jgi:hypothetical protein
MVFLGRTAFKRALLLLVAGGWWLASWSDRVDGWVVLHIHGGFAEASEGNPGVMFSKGRPVVVELTGGMWT